MTASYVEIETDYFNREEYYEEAGWDVETETQEEAEMNQAYYEELEPMEAQKNWLPEDFIPF